MGPDCTSAVGFARPKRWLEARFLWNRLSVSGRCD